MTLPIQPIGTRKWIRGIHYCYASAARPHHAVTVSTAEVRRRLQSRPLTRIRDGRTYCITGEARIALEKNGKGMLKRNAMDDMAYWKRWGRRVLLVPNGGNRYLLYVDDPLFEAEGGDGE